MNNIAVLFKNVTKKYYLEKPRSLKKWFSTFFTPFVKFTVIENFSFTIKKGEFVLITGPNGSGKTTLLKLIAGITECDLGMVETHGKVVPLIELGSGFNMELTGAENIIINATILGIDRQRVRKILPEIIDYAGLQNFIDVPLKRYSKGMISRLAFSIAAYSEPDILLLDEVFAVGDREFRKKSTITLENFKKNNTTIILCTHNPIDHKKVDAIIQLDKLAT